MSEENKSSEAAEELPNQSLMIEDVDDLFMGDEFGE